MAKCILVRHWSDHPASHWQQIAVCDSMQGALDRAVGERSQFPAHKLAVLIPLVWEPPTEGHYVLDHIDMQEVN